MSEGITMNKPVKDVPDRLYIGGEWRDAADGGEFPVENPATGEIIAKVGSLVGGLTYGASKEKSLEHFRAALKLNPDSAIARIEYANGIVMLGGKSKIEEATKLYAEAAACIPMDTTERLDIELAKSQTEG